MKSQQNLCHQCCDNHNADLVLHLINLDLPRERFVAYLVIFLLQILDALLVHAHHAFCYLVLSSAGHLLLHMYMFS